MLLAGQEHDRRYFLLAFIRDVLDDAEIAFAEEAAGIDGAGEERFHAVELVLLPGLHVRMVVALGAADVDAEEGGAGVDGELVQVLDARLDEIARPLHLRIVFVGQHHLAEHAIPAAILVKASSEDSRIAGFPYPPCGAGRPRIA